MRVVAFGLGVWLAVAARAGGPPPPTEPPELFYTIQYFEPGSRRFTVQGFMQYARPDSIDLERRPDGVRVPRVEASVSAERLVLQPRGANPERYRCVVPRGAPLAWEYVAEIEPGDSLPCVVGTDYACLQLDRVLLAPRVPRPDSVTAAAAAATKVSLRVQLGSKGRAFGPWPQNAGHFRARGVDDLVQNFVAIGAWRVRTHGLTEAAPCTLQVAIAGFPPAQDAAWTTAARALSNRDAGRSLVCIAPTKGPARVWQTRRSTLVLWPEQGSPPTTERLLTLVRQPASPR